MHPNFVDTINCFASFAKNTSQGNTLGAIKQILSLTGRLVEGNVDVRCDEHGSLLTDSPKEKHVDDANLPRMREDGRSHRLEPWRFSVYGLRSSARLVSYSHDAGKSCHGHAQGCAPGCLWLFSILSEQGTVLAVTWELIFKGVLFPIFDDVKHSEDGSESGRFIRDWLNNTCQDALNMLVGLFESPKRYLTLSFLLGDVLELVGTCIVHSNKLLARKGVVCLQRLLVDSGQLFPEKVWDRVCERMVSSDVSCSR